MSLFYKLQDGFDSTNHNIDVRFIQNGNGIKQIIFKTKLQLEFHTFSTIGVYKAKKDINSQLKEIKEQQIKEILYEVAKPEIEKNADSEDNTVDMKDYQNKKEQKKKDKDDKQPTDEIKLTEKDYNSWTKNSLKAFQDEINRLKKAKYALGIKEEDKRQLLPYIKKFNSDFTKIGDIVPRNIEDFCVFLEENFINKGEKAG